jgi:hypothetical protein
VTASLRQAGPRSAAGSPSTLHAPLFQELIGKLDETKRYVILDLGAASTAMLALLGQYRCRVEIADFAYFGGIGTLNSAEPGLALSDAAETCLPKQSPGDPVELVFCWDLPNYLTLDALSGMMHVIARRARPGAIAHALIYYSDPDMPQHPGRYLPATGGGLVDRRDQGEAIRAPRYSPEHLTKYMGGFQIDRARLLSNGMQEFLFRLGK